MSEDSPPALSLPGFRILTSIGEGGMGVVYLAEELALNRKVAIKMISQNTGSQPGAAARFLREARLMAHVEHPNIVRVYSFVESQGSTFLVMEYVEGESLSARLAKFGALPPDEALKILRQVIEALAAAWEKGIVHRDIKPSNILLDSKDRVHVADFGLAKPTTVDADSTLTRDGVVLGTPHYVSPEQILGKDVDFRSDIYSLGILFFEMLNGEKPFTGKTAVEVIQKNLNEPLPPFSSKTDEHARYRQLAEWMTQKRAEERPSSYEALLTAIDSIEQDTAFTHEVSSRAASTSIASAVWNWTKQVITLLFLVAAAWVVMQHFFPETSPIPSAAPQRNYFVAVAPFYGPDEASAREGRVMSSFAENAIVTRLGKETRIAGQEQVEIPVRDHEAARELGKKLNARIVVWGEVHSIQGETEIQPFFTIISKTEAKSFEIDPLEPDPFASFAEGTSGRVVVQDEAPDQIGLRRTTAESIGELVIFLAGINALYVDSDPERALLLFEEASASPQSAEYQARALIQLNRIQDARKVLEQAAAANAANASLLALIGDVRFEDGDWIAAVDAYQKSFELEQPIKTSRAILHQGKVYFKETYRSKRFTNGRFYETPYVLAADPQSRKVIQRIRIPGSVLSFTSDGSVLTALYDAGPTGESVLASAAIPANYTPAASLEANFSLRLQAIESGLAPASNFMNDLNDPQKAGSAKFESRTPEIFDDAPVDLPALETFLREQIDRDPTQPWHLFLLGQSLISQNRPQEAAQVFGSMFNSEYQGAAYFEFAAMAGLFESFGQHQLADEAYQNAHHRRSRIQVPVQSSSAAERALNSGFLRTSARNSDQMKPERVFEWWSRAIQLSGYSPYGDDFAAAAWRKYFKDKNEKWKEKSNEILAAAKQHPLNIVRAAAHLDYAFTALVALSAGFAFMIIWLLYRLVRRMFVDRSLNLANGFRFISGAEKFTFVFAFILFLVSMTVAVHLNHKLQNLFSIPALSMDSPGSSGVVSIFERNLSTNENDAARFCAAVANHIAGNRPRATLLYKAISTDDRAQKNLASLEGGNLIPPEPLTTADVARAFQHSERNRLLDSVMNPGDSLNVFAGDESGESSDGSSIPNLLYQLLILFAFFSVVQFVVTPGTGILQTSGNRASFWRWIIPGAFVSRTPFLSYLSLTCFVLVLFVIGVQYFIPHRFPVVGIVTLILLPGYSNAIPFPPPAAGQDTVQYYYWTLLGAYSGASLFFTILLCAALSLIALQVIAGLRFQHNQK